MAGRPTKQGIDYFPMDVGFFSDVKIRKISRACGSQSTSILICLLCNIYKDNGYYILWDEDLPFVIADTVGVSEGAVKEVMVKALQVGFFDNSLYEKFHILTSFGIQKRFLLATYQRKETEIIPEYLINNAINPINCTNNSINHVDKEQSKVKVKRKKNNAPSPPLKGGGKRKKKEVDGINSKARSIFENYFRETFSNSYYWTAKDAGAMSQLLNKLKFQREQKQMDVSDDSLLYALQYLLSSIKDGWIFENFSVTNINSKFNEIVSQTRKNHGTKPTYSNIYEQNRKDSEQRKLDSVLAVATTVREAAAKRRKELEAEGVIDKIP